MEAVTECGSSMKLVEIFLSAVNVLAGLLFPLLIVYLSGRGIL